MTPDPYFEKPAPPLPAANPETDFFWQGARLGVLMILRCQQCGTYVHFPRPLCPRCLSFDLAPEAVSGRGTLYSFTETHRPFHPFFVDRVPFLLGSVELDEQSGLRVLSTLVGLPEPEVRIGMAVEVDFEWLTPEFAVPVFKAAR